MPEHRRPHRIHDWHFRREEERVPGHDFVETSRWLRQQHFPHRHDAKQALVVVDHEDVSDECLPNELPQRFRRLCHRPGRTEYSQHGLHHLADCALLEVFIAHPLVARRFVGGGYYFLPSLGWEALQNVLRKARIEQHQHLRRKFRRIIIENFHRIAGRMRHEPGEQRFNFSLV